MGNSFKSTLADFYNAKNSLRDVPRHRSSSWTGFSLCRTLLHG